MDARIVFVTHPERGAREFARRLVEQRVAACCNLVPVVSVYRWQGELEEDGEVLLVVKTLERRLPELQAILDEHHPYDVPELVAWRPDHVSDPYLSWLAGEVEP